MSSSWLPINWTEPVWPHQKATLGQKGRMKYIRFLGRWQMEISNYWRFYLCKNITSPCPWTKICPWMILMTEVNRVKSQKVLVIREEKELFYAVKCIYTPSENSLHMKMAIKSNNNILRRYTRIMSPWTLITGWYRYINDISSFYDEKTIKSLLIYIGTIHFITTLSSLCNNFNIIQI